MKHLRLDLRSRVRFADMNSAISNMLRLAGSSILRGGGGPFSVLIYHRVLSQPDRLMPDEPTREQFAWQLDLLASQFNVLALGDALERQRRGSLPPRCVCITFDDGYADNAEVALPELQRRQLPATFFVASDFLDGGCMWNDHVIAALRDTAHAELDLRELGLDRYASDRIESRRRSLDALIGALKYRPQAERADLVRRIRDLAETEGPDGIMMSPDQVRELAAAGMEIGGHTMSHPILASIGIDDAECEIGGGRERLQEITGTPVRLFAYPNGRPGTDFGAEHVALVRRLGFDAAVTTSWGAHRRGGDDYQIPRFTPWDRDGFRFNLRLLHNALINRPARV